ncbi:hypothetical protein IFM89_002150 [Coptis chinensis]|uniref:Anamorsin homolog n=1 Tax=Coptis chinensis TaxID=261450 RepID=A0A835I8J4_9MAGN|nr:hypothetical protein IFM89_002150 [Coptis chinensis]
MGSISQDAVEMNGSVLALTDNVVIPVSAVLNAIEEHGVKRIEQNDPLIITQALSLKQLPITSSSMDVVVFVLTTHELPGHELLEEMFRALKPGGAVTFQKSQSVAVNKDEIVSTLKRRLLLAGFLDAKVPLENLNSFTVRANKPSWKMGSSFTIKKSTKSLPKVQIDNDLDLIDEDSLLTEEDLKKPQLLPVDDCEVGSTRKACKNCSCGRAEACGLGDAFRCGSCPYKGLPPFKLGEKVSLAGNFLASDF